MILDHNSIKRWLQRQPNYAHWLKEKSLKNVQKNLFVALKNFTMLNLQFRILFRLIEYYQTKITFVFKFTKKFSFTSLTQMMKMKI